MLPILFNQSSLPAVEQTLQFAERRHALLASNVANADTPGYQTRDLSVEDFQRSLKEVIQANHRVGMDGEGKGANRSYQGISQSQAMKNVRESMKQILYHDGSDVGLETQVTEIAKNQSMHSMAVAILRNQYHLMEMAISGSVNV